MMNNYTNQTPIQSFNEADRPREKMLLLGKHAMDDDELIAILIGSGTIGKNAIALAKEILLSVNNDLSELGKREIKDLQKFSGIGEAKALVIAAALEIGRRRQFSDARQREKVTCSRDIYEIMSPELIDLNYEEFHVLLLNRANHVLRKAQISKGGVSGTVVDAKLVFKPAIDALATSIVLCHNHPSGNLRPSQADIDLTKKLKQAAIHLDMHILDHLIVAQTGYYSFADAGTL